VQGIIGIGLLGSAIAERLQQAGLELVGWDVDSGNLERASAARHVKTLEPGKIAATCDRIVLCLPNSGVVESVVSEIEDHLRPGGMVIDTTTGSPAAVERVAERLAQRDVTYLDACVGGSSEDVRQHRAMVLCGGPAAAF
jgi:3-hydroxyisobutyrate dehydrogenase-like beta-hydroxyacid dehydrogenase